FQSLKASPEARYGGDFVIPVVVHVVYNTTAQQISLAQVQSQIDALNHDYYATNPDISSVPAEFSGAVTNVPVAFGLAQRTPGCGSTNGIEYVSTSVTGFTFDDQVKYASSGGADAWPATDYLNVWVCALTGGLLGYAQFPSGASATDGVVVDYR